MTRTIRHVQSHNFALPDEFQNPFRPAVRARLSRMEIRFARTVGRTVASRGGILQAKAELERPTRSRGPRSASNVERSHGWMLQTKCGPAQAKYAIYGRCLKSTASPMSDAARDLQTL
jgi:hypothetical protein